MLLQALNPVSLLNGRMPISQEASRNTIAGLADRMGRSVAAVYRYYPSKEAVVRELQRLVATHIGVRIMGLTLGLLFGGHSLGAAFGSVLGGWFFDVFGRYDELWWLSGGLAALAGVCAAMIRENRDRGPKPVPAAA